MSGMDLTRYAIENRVVTFVALVAIAFSGYSAYRQLPRAEDPGFLVRYAIVRTQFPGASPERVELLVTDKIESAIQQIPEVAHITSESRTGVSIVNVEIRESVTELRPVWDDLRRKVEGAARELPQGVVPVVDDEFGDVFGTVIALTADGFSYSELEATGNQVRDAILKVEDVAKVDLHGVQEERVFVDFDNARLSRLGLSAAQLQGILQASNIIISGGVVETGVERITLEPTGNFTSVDDIRRTVITLPQTGETVYLGDVADVRRGYVEPPRSVVRANGQSALVLAVSMREGGNIIQLGANLMAAVAELEARYPVGVAFDILAFQADVVDRAVSSCQLDLSSGRHRARLHAPVSGLPHRARGRDAGAHGDPGHADADAVSGDRPGQDVACVPHHRARAARRQLDRDERVDSGAHARR